MRIASILLYLCGVQALRMPKNVAARRETTREEKISSRGASAQNHAQGSEARFLNAATAPYAVNGSALPSIPFDVGESYAGLLPISSDVDEKKKLFFWFFPTRSAKPKKEITIWLNGGPGCSSMIGILTENGPISWVDGASEPSPNLYTWLNLTNVVWIDQPVGVGFAEGEIEISTEPELAVQFAGFWKNFVTLFCMEDWRMYLTGESYAGVYIPYIADTFIDSGDPVYYNLAGVALIDPIVGTWNVQMNIAVPSYTAHWNHVLGLNDSFMADLASRADECGMTKYLETYLRFPPPEGPFPYLEEHWNQTWAIETCNMLESVQSAWRLVNPCLNSHHVTDVCPYPVSILGPTYATIPPAPGSPSAYFNQPDVQAAVHVPAQSDWVQCVGAIFRNLTDPSILAPSDPYSYPPAVTDLFGRTIEYTNNVVIGSGGLDMLMPTNGTLLALQNVTWGGVQGFQERPSQEFFSPYDPFGVQSMAGIVGTWGSERGLTFYEVATAGHELPRYASGPAYRSMELLLGRISNLSQMGSFTTQMGGPYGDARYLMLTTSPRQHFR